MGLFENFTKLDLLLLCTVLTASFVIARYYYLSNQDKIENYYFNKHRAAFPENLNMRALDKINDCLTSDADFSFVVLGDNSDNYTKLRQIIKDSARHKPEFIIHTGDFTRRGKYREYLKIVEIVNETEIPIIFAAGNHDLENKGIEWFAYIFGPLNFYGDIGRYRFFFLDNAKKTVNSPLLQLTQTRVNFNNYKQQRGLDVNEIKDLEMLLQQKQHNFIIMHAPLPIAPFSGRSFSRNAERFMEMLQKNRGRICRIFSGHIHAYGEIKFAGIPCIVGGGAGSKLYSKEGIISKHHYILTKVENNHVRHQVFFVE